MATLYGANGALGLIVEVTHPTDPTGTPTNFMEFDEIAIDFPVEHVRPASMRRRNGAITSAAREGKNGPVKLTMEGFLTYDASGILWHSFIGGSSTSGAGDPYTHTYVTTSTPETPSYTAEYIYDGVSNSRRASGCRGHTLSLSCSEGTEWRFSAEYMGVSFADPAAKSTITYGSTQLVPMWSDATITWNSIDLHLHTRSIKIDFGNGLNARGRFGSRTAAEIYSDRQRTATATIEYDLDSARYNTFQAAMEALTASDLVITITDPAVSNRTITITLNDCRVTSPAWGKQKGSEMVRLSLTFTATATTSADLCGVVVVNGIASAVGNG